MKRKLVCIFKCLIVKGDSEKLFMILEKEWHLGPKFQKQTAGTDILEKAMGYGAV